MTCPICGASTAGLCKRCEREQRLTREHEEYRRSGVSPTSWNSRQPEREAGDD